MEKELSLSPSMEQYVKTSMTRLMTITGAWKSTDSWMEKELRVQNKLYSWEGCEELINMCKNALKDYDCEKNWLSRGHIKNLMRILKSCQKTQSKTVAAPKNTVAVIDDNKNLFSEPGTTANVVERLKKYGNTVVSYHMYEAWGPDRIKKDLKEKGLDVKVECTNYNLTKDCFENKEIVNGAPMWVISPILPIVKITAC